MRVTVIATQFDNGSPTAKAVENADYTKPAAAAAAEEKAEETEEVAEVGEVEADTLEVVSGGDVEDDFDIIRKMFER